MSSAFFCAEMHLQKRRSSSINQTRLKIEAHPGISCSDTFPPSIARIPWLLLFNVLPSVPHGHDLGLGRQSLPSAPLLTWLGLSLSTSALQWGLPVAPHQLLLGWSLSRTTPIWLLLFSNPILPAVQCPLWVLTVSRTFGLGTIQSSLTSLSSPVTLLPVLQMPAVTTVPPVSLRQSP